MGTYQLPRNVKGEGRILFIFTPKSLIYTAIAAAIGLIFYFIFSSIIFQKTKNFSYSPIYIKGTATAAPLS